MKHKLTLSEKILIFLYTLPALILLISECSCKTPAITIYQQGVGIGDNRIKVTEKLNLNDVVTIYEGKSEKGQKVITKRKLK